MNTKLALFCACLWALGLTSMTIIKGIFHLGPGSTPFDASALAWGVGGLTYCMLGAVCLIADREG